MFSHSTNLEIEVWIAEWYRFGVHPVPFAGRFTLEQAQTACVYHAMERNWFDFDEWIVRHYDDKPSDWIQESTTHQVGYHVYPMKIRHQNTKLSLEIPEPE